MALQQPTRKNPAGPTGPRITEQCQNIRVGDGADAPKLPTEPTSGFKKIKPPKDTTVVEGDAAIISTIELPGDVLCCKFNEDYSLIAAGCADGSVRVYNSETNEFVSTLTDEETKTNKTVSVTAIEHRPVTKNYPINNCYTCTYVNGLVKCWNYNFNQCIYTIREKRQTYGLAYHPRLPKIITYGDDFKIYLYDEETKIQERVLQARNTAKLNQ